MENKKFNPKKFAIILIIVFIIIIAAIYLVMSKTISFNKNALDNNQVISEKVEVQAQTNNKESQSEYFLKDNNISKFDLSFLKFENEKENIIYSPLSIKYAFKMLEDATVGESNKQISDVVGKYDITKYSPNENMAFANSFFIKNSFKDEVKQSYIDTIKSRYDAEVQFDDFASAKNINNWVKKNTLGLIDGLLEDSDVTELEFALINALGIDMEWNHKFLEYYQEDDKNITDYVDYKHEKLDWFADKSLFKLDFYNSQKVSSMRVVATLNNYDIVKELGEEKIKQTVKDDFTRWAKSEEKYDLAGDVNEYFENDFSDSGIEKAFEKYWNTGNHEGQKGYLAEIKENYGEVDYTTDFSIYVDDSVKVFAKDLKEYNGTTLQYIGIMPIHQDLDEYIAQTSEDQIKDLISKLKDLKLENFRDGVLTKIVGFIPKFKFEYDLNIQNDLEKLGITDVFEQGKANLTNLTNDENMYIGNIKHKANIEFTQDGIKASAATFAGGMGAGGFYDYIFEIPTEYIDITFDKPYMFIIRDKDTGETWFVGTVYEPLDSIEDSDSDLLEINKWYKLLGD